ncbi:PDZ domain-containing protein [Colwellia asteriadis]|uniref:PDZ domain-containing protein n=1 Tax=Colwellia asteriadis TaxID=517723 RepID=A0ABN1L6C5_9GAMM
MVLCKSLLFTLLLYLIAFSANAEVNVTINIDNPEHHLATVQVQFKASETKDTLVYLPTWRTGRYEILNLANGIRKFSAQDEQGNALLWEKVSKDSWRINNTQHKKLTVTYQVYANQLGKRTRHIDDSHAFIDNSTVVMYSEESRPQKHIVQMVVPKAWRSVSGLDFGDNHHQFIASNYDVLVDSPIESGINQFFEFEVDNRQYELVIWGEGNYDTQKMLQDLTVMVEQSKSIWQGYPFKRYVFMVHATSGARGATEHVNSTIIQRSRYKFSARKDYIGFISTAAHEFVHTWNVKQYRPEGLVPYDYQQENYDNLLWLAEGSTSYLQYQLLLRGKLLTSKEFFEDLAKRITKHQHKPGRNSQSIAQAGFDAWINESGDYGNNHSVNIYAEGYLASWLLDFDILSRTNLAKSYRNVHNQLYQQFKIPKSYNENDILAILNQVTGENYQPWWQQNITGLLAIDFDALLAKAGLQMSYGKAGAKLKTQIWTGLKTEQVNSGLKVTHVEKHSPAWDAGFTLDDIIIAIDGLRLVDKDLTTRLADFNDENTVDISFFRRDVLASKSLALVKRPKDKLKVTPLENANEQQKAFFTQWTGLEFPEDKK